MGIGEWFEDNYDLTNAISLLRQGDGGTVEIDDEREQWDQVMSPEQVRQMGMSPGRTEQMQFADEPDEIAIHPRFQERAVRERDPADLIRVAAADDPNAGYELDAEGDPIEPTIGQAPARGMQTFGAGGEPVEPGLHTGDVYVDRRAAPSDLVDAAEDTERYAWETSNNFREQTARASRDAESLYDTVMPFLGEGLPPVSVPSMIMAGSRGLASLLPDAIEGIGRPYSHEAATTGLQMDAEQLGDMVGDTGEWGEGVQGDVMEARRRGDTGSLAMGQAVPQLALALGTGRIPGAGRVAGATRHGADILAGGIGGASWAVPEFGESELGHGAAGASMAAGPLAFARLLTKTGPGAGSVQQAAREAGEALPPFGGAHGPQPIPRTHVPQGRASNNATVALRAGRPPGAAPSPDVPNVEAAAENGALQNLANMLDEGRAAASPPVRGRVIEQGQRASGTFDEPFDHFADAYQRRQAAGQAAPEPYGDGGIWEQVQREQRHGMPVDEAMVVGQGPLPPPTPPRRPPPVPQDALATGAYPGEVPAMPGRQGMPVPPPADELGAAHQAVLQERRAVPPLAEGAALTTRPYPEGLGFPQRDLIQALESADLMPAATPPPVPRGRPSAMEQLGLNFDATPPRAPAPRPPRIPPPDPAQMPPRPAPPEASPGSAPAVTPLSSAELEAMAPPPRQPAPPPLAPSASRQGPAIAKGDRVRALQRAGANFEEAAPGDQQRIVGQRFVDPEAPAERVAAGDAHIQGFDSMAQVPGVPDPEYPRPGGTPVRELLKDLERINDTAANTSQRKRGRAQVIKAWRERYPEFGDEWWNARGNKLGRAMAGRRVADMPPTRRELGLQSGVNIPEDYSGPRGYRAFYSPDSIADPLIPGGAARAQILPEQLIEAMDQAARRGVHALKNFEGIPAVERAGQRMARGARRGGRQALDFIQNDPLMQTPREYNQPLGRARFGEGGGGQMGMPWSPDAPPPETPFGEAMAGPLGDHAQVMGRRGMLLAAPIAMAGHPGKGALAGLGGLAMNKSPRGAQILDSMARQARYSNIPVVNEIRQLFRQGGDAPLRAVIALHNAMQTNPEFRQAYQEAEAEADEGQDDSLYGELEYLDEAPGGQTEVGELEYLQ